MKVRPRKIFRAAPAFVTRFTWWLRIVFPCDFSTISTRSSNVKTIQERPKIYRQSKYPSMYESKWKLLKKIKQPITVYYRCFRRLVAT